MENKNNQPLQKVQLGDIIFLKKNSIKELRSLQSIEGRVSYKNHRPYCIIGSDPRNEKILLAVPINSKISEFKGRAKSENTTVKYKFYDIWGEKRCLNVSRTDRYL